MNNRILLAVAMVAFCLPLHANLNSKGIIRLHDLEGQVIHFTNKWQLSQQRYNFKSQSHDKASTSGTLTTPAGPIHLSTTLNTQGDTIKASFQAKANQLPTNALAFEISLPVATYATKFLIIDGNNITLPEKLDKPQVHSTTAKKLSIPVYNADGPKVLSITGNLNIFLQDNRKFKGDSFGLRIAFSKHRPTLSTASLSWEAKLEDGTQTMPKNSVTIVADENWRPFTYTKAIKPGSIMDLSSLVESPAGKYGPVIINDIGKFAFKSTPTKPVRFHGINLCFSANFLNKEWAEKFAKRMRRSGYNSIRFHHFDSPLTGWWTPETFAIDPEMMDKLDYMLYCFKQEGIYISLDLFASRVIPKGVIPEVDDKRPKLKGLMPIYNSAFEAWAQFARALLTHKNKYTGIPWKDDPAVFSLCLTNENNLYTAYRDLGAKHQAKYHEKYKAFAVKHGYDAADKSATTPGWAHFFSDLQTDLYQRSRKVVKDLGTHIHTTDANYLSHVLMVPTRQTFDYVDNHAYWDHPQFVDQRWRLPEKYHNQSAVAKRASVPRTIMPSRIFGKPFMVTEYNYTAPNQYRAEGGVLMGAYAALQDWDGIYRFAYAHKEEFVTQDAPVRRFDVAADPIGLVGDRISSLLFLREDVTPATTKVPYIHDWKHFGIKKPLGWGQGPFKNHMSVLGLQHQVGSLTADALKLSKETFPYGVTRAGTPIPGVSLKLKSSSKPILPNGKPIQSETKEIDIDATKGTFRVVTKKTECLIIPPGQSLIGSFLSVTNHSKTPTVVVASAVDNVPLSESKRILVFHLSDVQSSGTHFRDAAMQILEDPGKLPHLMRVAKTTVRLNVNGMQAKAVSLDGTHLDVEVPHKSLKAGLSFEANTVVSDKGIFAYAIEPKK